MIVPFSQLHQDAARTLIKLSLAEDLQQTGDLTCQALIEETDQAEIQIVARQAGILAGSPITTLIFEELDSQVVCEHHLADGAALEPGSVISTCSGPLASLLTGERTVLNFLTHLCGVASQTAQYVEAVKGTNACILDTRKTLPGWRVLEKYAVAAGGGTNHRMGLYDGILIKDNHLAAWATRNSHPTIAAAVKQARESVKGEKSVEVEVDTLEQLTDALEGAPEIVLLDNMSTDTLREAIQMRDAQSPATLLEASGGINLNTVRAVAETGVERISVGALTHSVISLDIGFDWKRRT
ncbi:Nicotinate-nucleotide pyrophosphorylase [carboxylating] [Gimesia panareensis]|uniref:Probable nicotinate-nucleotide pyrophosphorylase [carboxylating] n=1 Tax=Gimesia panareensis TaxID=2527978 RepID=A0A518FQ72_9PLAN|nr:carboxylating nicotinate-nucleotide diphosphorylase [Gimesia panareensis]QDV18496.1 Nicotinate-nucleotide pyrophosphorylase [carboxylating] [Gimesia panareensis]